MFVLLKKLKLKIKDKLNETKDIIFSKEMVKGDGSRRKGINNGLVKII